MRSMAVDIVDRITEYDISPPDSDYTPYRFGIEIAPQVDSGLVANVIRQCIEKLPGTLAESFLDGFLEMIDASNVDEILFDALRNSLEVGSGAAVVRLMRKFSSLTDEEIAVRIINQIASDNESAAQDRFAFALWSLICGEAYDVAAESTYSVPVRVGWREMTELLRKEGLSDYTRATLLECYQRKSSQSGS
jgi:hypothetical protein